MTPARYVRQLVEVQCDADVARLFSGKCHDCGESWDAGLVPRVEGQPDRCSIMHYCVCPFDLEAGEGAA